MNTDEAKPSPTFVARSLDPSPQGTHQPPPVTSKIQEDSTANNIQAQLPPTPVAQPHQSPVNNEVQGDSSSNIGHGQLPTTSAAQVLLTTSLPVGPQETVGVSGGLRNLQPPDRATVAAPGRKSRGRGRKPIETPPCDRGKYREKYEILRVFHTLEMVSHIQFGLEEDA